MEDLKETLEKQLLEIYRKDYPIIIQDILTLLQLGYLPDRIIQHVEGKLGPSYTTNNLYIVANYLYKQYYETGPKTGK